MVFSCFFSIARILAAVLCVGAAACFADAQEKKNPLDLALDFSSMDLAPVEYKGRFRPFAVYSDLFFYDFYHKKKIPPKELEKFHAQSGNTSELLWKLYFLGREAWEEAPFFFVANKKLRSLLASDAKEQHFSFSQLRQVVESEKTATAFLSPLLAYHFLKSYHDPSNRSQSQMQQLKALASDLWAGFKGDDIVLTASSKTPPWSLLRPGIILQKHAKEHSNALEKSLKGISDDVLKVLSQVEFFSKITSEELFDNSLLQQSVQTWKKQGLPPKEIALKEQTLFPLQNRLKNLPSFFKMLPLAKGKGEFVSLKALELKVYSEKTNDFEPVKNFTAYSDQDFASISSAYFSFKTAFLSGSGDVQKKFDALAKALIQAYTSIEKTSYKQASGKSLTYPGFDKLKAEALYVRFSLTSFAMIGYLLAAVAFVCCSLFKKQRVEKILLAIFLGAFFFHLLDLSLRIFILGRPPVANMAETYSYVSFIAAGSGLALYFVLKQRIALFAAAIASFLLFTVSLFSFETNDFENVQAVLDSEYWLLTHVLLVVGSYGLFLLSSIFGHCYLLSSFKENNQDKLKSFGVLIFQTMCLGVAMLISGTLLGGVWAAESWGRFWDWDPKESWAFISSGAYLLFIHAYIFKKIHYFGLAAGAVLGFLTISFTWYGVNYILATGLHSYGFGSGGESWYLAFIVGEILFLTVVRICSKSYSNSFPLGDRKNKKAI